MKKYFQSKNKVNLLLILGFFLLAVFISSQLKPGEQTTSTQAQQATSSILAFPGAEGFGANTKGGRGGRVIEVTNLNDSGPGSLRDCATASGSRVCVFRVAGTITLNSDIVITNPFITIAGQTAPGGGITIKAGNPNSTTGIYIKASEVIIRYIRSRPGTLVTNSRALSINNGSTSMSTAVQNVILDHNSFSWAGDELTITWLATNKVSYQWNIASESLSPWKGPSFGEDGGGNFSVHHNLIAHHSQRSPQVSASVGPIDLVNNVIYNPGGLGSVAKNGTHVNYVKNYIKRGPNTSLSFYVNDSGNDVKGPAAAIYLNGNHLDGIQNIINSNTHVVSTRLTAPVVTETDPQTAFNQVLANAGASQGLNCSGTWIPRRDSVDMRVVQSVTDGTRGHSGTGYITSPSQVGGWPNLDPGTACTDSDHDGMPDQWETANFGNISQGSPNASTSDFDNDGYTDLEEFLNGTNPKSGGSGLTPTISISPTRTPTPTPNVHVPTATRTPTSSPTGARLRFKIKLPDIASSVTDIPAEEVSVALIDGSVPLAETGIALVRSGDYFQTSGDTSFNISQNKAYTIAVKTKSSLRRSFTGVNLTQNQLLDCTAVSNTNCGSLISQRDAKQLFSGDSDGFNRSSGSYNRVDSADLQALTQVYGAQSQTTNSNSDFNLDSAINILDLEILGKNYGKIGD